MATANEYYYGSSKAVNTLTTPLDPAKISVTRPDRTFGSELAKANSVSTILEILGIWMWFIGDLREIYVTSSIFPFFLLSIAGFQAWRAYRFYRLYRDAEHQTQEDRNTFLLNLYSSIAIFTAVSLILAQVISGLAGNSEATAFLHPPHIQMTITLIFLSGSILLFIRSLYNVFQIRREKPLHYSTDERYKTYRQLTILYGIYLIAVPVLFILPNLLLFLYGSSAPDLPLEAMSFIAVLTIIIIAGIALKDWLSARKTWADQHVPESLLTKETELSLSSTLFVPGKSTAPESVPSQPFFGPPLFSDYTEFSAEGRLIRKLNNFVTNFDSVQATFGTDNSEKRLQALWQDISSKANQDPYSTSNGIQVIYKLLQENWNPNTKTFSEKITPAQLCEAIDALVHQKHTRDPINRHSDIETWYNNYQPLTWKLHVIKALEKLKEPGCFGSVRVTPGPGFFYEGSNNLEDLYQQVLVWACAKPPTSAEKQMSPSQA